ncbi:MAG: BrxE family protein [Syntrophomonadaceae bacterium]|jgi:hypothetical protein|nr:BrxE family protein [Syntrophomonadaceae bacterium]
MKKTINTDLIRLRFIAGYLGEQLQPKWWTSSFFAQGSTMFLSPVFSKTAILAKYHGIQEAASRIHDERIGIGTSVFHLFRLPEAIERELHQHISDSDNMDQFIKDLASASDALNALVSFSDNESRQAVGPVRIGGHSDLKKTDSWRAVASYYQQAFATQHQTFPYYSEVR